MSGGADFTYCSFASTEFRAVNAAGSHFDDSLFDLATLAKDVNFDDATLKRAIFTGASVHASFKGGDLELSIFSSADVHDADFRGATLDEATFATALGREYARTDGELPLGPDNPESELAKA
jgi:uncharacterized protein YjbI with pentapeptide repeats